MYITVTLFLNVRGNAEEKSIEERSGERERGADEIDSAQIGNVK